METDQTIQPSDLDEAWKVALAARKNAYAPYSQFKVGAALKLVNEDTIIPGCNVENASYGATICAERSAIVSACTQFGKLQIAYVVIVTGESKPTVPCALCLQVIAEFSTPNTLVFSGNEAGITGKWHFKELLPKPFTSFE